MKEKTKNSIQIITLNYIGALIPLFLYGIYKNGIILYQKNYFSILDILLLIFIPISGFLIGLLVEYLFTKDEITNILKNSFLPLYGLLAGFIINPNINILLFLIIVFIGLSFVKILSKEKKLVANPVAIIKTIFIIVLVILGKNLYQNNYEYDVSMALSLTDVIFGKGISGLFTSNIFLILIALVFLSFTKLYKKEIPLYMISSFALVTTIISIIINDNINILLNIFNSTFFFGAVFIAPLIITSTYTKKGKIVYGVILGIICSFLTMFISKFDGVFISILLVSITVKFIDNFFELK